MAKSPCFMAPSSWLPVSISTCTHLKCSVQNFLCDIISSPSYDMLLLPVLLNLLTFFLCSTLVRARVLSDTGVSNSCLLCRHYISSPSKVTSPCMLPKPHMPLSVATSQFLTCHCYAKYLKSHIVHFPFPQSRFMGNMLFYFW